MLIVVECVVVSLCIGRDGAVAELVCAISVCFGTVSMSNGTV